MKVIMTKTVPLQRRDLFESYRLGLFRRNLGGGTGDIKAHQGSALEPSHVSVRTTLISATLFPFHTGHEHANLWAIPLMLLASSLNISIRNRVLFAFVRCVASPRVQCELGVIHNDAQDGDGNEVRDVLADHESETDEEVESSGHDVGDGHVVVLLRVVHPQVRLVEVVAVEQRCLLHEALSL